MMKIRYFKIDILFCMQKTVWEIYLGIAFNYSKHKLFIGKAEVGYLSSNDMLHEAI